MIKNVKILPGCIACKTCEGVCPAIFRIEGTSQVVSRDFAQHEKAIFQARDMCPVNVIAVEADGEEISSFQDTTLATRRDLTPDVVELTFAIQDFSFVPGQYVSLQMRDAVGSFVRSYSIVRSDNRGFTLCIKLLSGGRGGVFLRSLTVGQSVKVSPASGAFVVQHTAYPKVCIATGTGIAPMLAILHATPAHISKTVIFGVRTEADLFYLAELQMIPNTTVICTVSQPGATWTGARGRVTDHLAGIAHDTEVYICGNPDMVQSVQAALQKQGHLPKQVFAEEFVLTHAVTAPATPLWQRMIPIMNWIFILLAAIVPAVWYFTDLKNLLWDVSWYSVTVLLLIRPLGDLLLRFTWLRRLLLLRQGLGILSSAVVVTNLAFTVAGDPFALFSATAWGIDNPSTLGHIAELTGFVLLVTSNGFSQRLLGTWWKRIQRFAYFYFFAAGIYLVYLGKTGAAVSMALVALLWIAAYIKKAAH